ncbi:MAG: hypothetical protein RIT81_18050 [Deltaproteobacteria bacterium]
MSSYTYTESLTFTVTHARHMAAKIATDLKRIQRFYGEPSDSKIVDYETEAIALMKAGYLSSVTYGFKRDGRWIEPTVKYTSRDLASGGANDDDPGKIAPMCDVSGATFTSFLIRTASYGLLNAAQRDAFDSELPVQRTTGTEPQVDGYLETDRTYSAGGRALDRARVRSR